MNERLLEAAKFLQADWSPRAQKTAALLEAVYHTHQHYGDCNCVEATAADELAKEILGWPR